MSRYRSYSPDIVYTSEMIYSDNSGYEENRGTWKQKQVTESITDVVTKNYDARIKAGAVINNEMSYSFEQHTSTGGSFQKNVQKTDPNYWDQKDGGSATEESFIPYGCSVISAADTTDVNVAKLAAIAAMDSTEYAFGEDLGEIGQTIRFLKNPIKHLTDLTRRHKRTESKLIRKRHKNLTRRRESKESFWRRREAAKAKAIADSWAVYQWAYQPLVRSVSDLTEALMTQTANRKPRYSSRGFSRSNITVEDPDAATGALTGIHNVVLDKEIHATILYENHRNDNPTLKKFGLRLKDTPETAWQLFPLSFMVDRVANISQSISAVQNLLDSDLRILAASVTTRAHEVETWQYQARTSTTHYHTVVGDKVIAEKFHMNRVIWSPSLSDCVPPVKPGNLLSDTHKILDALALITQRIVK